MYKLKEPPASASYELLRASNETIASALRNSLEGHFGEVKVTASADSPDLSAAPWGLAASGLCGKPTLVELGGVPYLLPTVDRSRRYDCRSVLQATTSATGLLIGAAAAPFWEMPNNVNGELMANVSQEVNLSKVARVLPDGDGCVMEPAPSSHNALLGNFLCCEGKSGSVIRVEVRHRLTEGSFITMLRRGLSQKFGEEDQPVGLGGVFLLQQGSAKMHVMPDFSCTPLTCDDEVNSWLKFYDMAAPLVCVGTMVSHDPGNWDLRLEHFHGWQVSKSDKLLGGHYHHDTKPEEAHYTAYLQVAENLLRIDPPSVSHQFGRD